jgi:hypothetical protein
VAIVRDAKAARVPVYVSIKIHLPSAIHSFSSNSTGLKLVVRSITTIMINVDVKVPVDSRRIPCLTVEVEILNCRIVRVAYSFFIYCSVPSYSAMFKKIAAICVAIYTVSIG